jgi:hypothetical protein
VKPKEPLKLMPLQEFEKAVAAISRVPKEAVEKAAREAKASDYPAGKPKEKRPAG